MCPSRRHCSCSSLWEHKYYQCEHEEWANTIVSYNPPVEWLSTRREQIQRAFRLDPDFFVDLGLRKYLDLWQALLQPDQNTLVKFLHSEVTRIADHTDHFYGQYEQQKAVSAMRCLCHCRMIKVVLGQLLRTTESQCLFSEVMSDPDIAKLRHMRHLLFYAERRCNRYLEQYADNIAHILDGVEWGDDKMPIGSTRELPGQKWIFSDYPWQNGSESRNQDSNIETSLRCHGFIDQSQIPTHLEAERRIIESDSEPECGKACDLLPTGTLEAHEQASKVGGLLVASNNGHDMSDAAPVEVDQNQMKISVPVEPVVPQEIIARDGPSFDGKDGSEIETSHYEKNHRSDSNSDFNLNLPATSEETMPSPNSNKSNNGSAKISDMAPNQPQMPEAPSRNARNKAKKKAKKQAKAAENAKTKDVQGMPVKESTSDTVSHPAESVKLEPTIDENLALRSKSPPNEEGTCRESVPGETSSPLSQPEDVPGLESTSEEDSTSSNGNQSEATTLSDGANSGSEHPDRQPGPFDELIRELPPGIDMELILGIMAIGLARKARDDA